MMYADRGFESCCANLSKQGITLYCCDTKAHVPFDERGTRFVKERIRCVSMLPKKIKRKPSRLMGALVISTVKMIN